MTSVLLDNLLLAKKGYRKKANSSSVSQFLDSMILVYLENTNGLYLCDRCMTSGDDGHCPDVSFHVEGFLAISHC
jgi:hypothetical protein